MELTKEFRHNVYALMLDALIIDVKTRKHNPNNYVCEGLCVYLQSINRFTTVYMSTNDIEYINNIDNYPELVKHKPKYYTTPSLYWFSLSQYGAAIRIEILEQAIKETE